MGRIAKPVGEGHSLVFSTATTTFTRAPDPSAQVAVIRTRPSTASRRRTTRPTTVPSPDRTSSTASPAGNRNASSCPVAAGGSSGTGARSTVRSTASSQGTTGVPPTSSASVSTNAGPAAAWTVRRSTWRQRTRTASVGAVPGSTMHSVRADQRSEPSVSLKALGASTPNCQRTWFLRAEARYGIQHVALEEDRVGDGAGRGEAVGHRRRSPPHRESSPAFLSRRSSAWSHVGSAWAAL